MTALRRLAWVSLVLGYGHIVFGAIVRITGSGMGCGEHWPRCQGYWFPPLARPDLIIEVSHRYFAATLTGAILITLLVAWQRRDERGVGGPDGVLRPLLLAAILVVTAALFGAVTVWLALANKAVIVTHLAIAMSLLATLVVAVVRAGGPPRFQKYAVASSPSSSSERDTYPSNADDWKATRGAARGAYAVAALAFITVVLGALTANIPGANSACTGFPLCDGGILPTAPSQHLQFTHRILAFVLFFHLLGLAFAALRRGERGVATLAFTAFGATVAQVLVAATMVDMQLPAVLRSVHEAIGTAVWVAVCFLTYAAHLAAAPSRAPRTASTTIPGEGVRA
ncbi:MAG: COX15/CtaA family protein [Gemmatimonadaceae bacterium]